MDHPREGEKNNDQRERNYHRQNRDINQDWYKMEQHPSFCSSNPPMMPESNQFPQPENRLPSYPFISITPYHHMQKTAFQNTAYDPTTFEADFSRLNLSTPSRSSSYGGLALDRSFLRNSLSDSSLNNASFINPPTSSSSQLDHHHIDWNLQRMRVESAVRGQKGLYLDYPHGFSDLGAEELLDLDGFGLTGLNPSSLSYTQHNNNGGGGYANIGGLTRWNNRLNPNGFYEVGGYGGAPSNNLTSNGFSSVYGTGYGAPSNPNRIGVSSVYDTGYGAPSNATDNRNGFQSAYGTKSDFEQERNGSRVENRRKGRPGTWADKSRSPCVNGNNNNKNLMSPLSECLNARPFGEWRGNIVFLAKDPHGWTFLKKKIEENKREEIEMIFMEVKDQVRELMMDQYGNYSIQKIFEVANEDQMTQMLLLVLNDKHYLMSICLDTHGTRAMQKMLEHLTTPEQVSLVMSVITEMALVLTKSIGYKVIESCFTSFTNEQNMQLVNVIADNCVDIAMNQVGCCVLQKCMDHSEGEPRDRLIGGLISNALVLSEHIFGNYVVQYIIEKKKPLYTEDILAQLAGSFVSLSMNKYGSNVVEKCIKYFNEEQATRVIREIIDSRNFLMVLQDPFGNYVTQTALEIAKGSLRQTILVLIQHHYPYLQSHPHGKRVLAKTRGNGGHGKHHREYDYRR